MIKAMIVLAAGLVISVSASALAADVAPGDVKVADNMIKASLTGKSGDAMKGADVFVGLSVRGLVSKEMVASMAPATVPE